MNLTREEVERIKARHEKDQGANPFIKEQIWSAALEQAHADRGLLLEALLTAWEALEDAVTRYENEVCAGGEECRLHARWRAALPPSST